MDVRYGVSGFDKQLVVLSDLITFIDLYLPFKSLRSRIFSFLPSYTILGYGDRNLELKQKDQNQPAGFFWSFVHNADFYKTVPSDPKVTKAYSPEPVT